MGLPVANPTFGAEVARLARCFDAVGPIFAAACGTPWDELEAVGDQIWAFPGGDLSLTWNDDVLSLWGGSLGYEQCAFGGMAWVALRPIGEGDMMSDRRAHAILSLKALAARGSSLATDCAYLDLNPAIGHVYPAGDDEVCAFITVPFRLIVVLQTTLGVNNETTTTSAETRHQSPQ